MNTQHNLEGRLWDYIDGVSGPEEKSFVEQLLATEEPWRKKYRELLDLHQLMNHSLELEEPSLRFTQNVMDEIARHHIAPATKNYINKKIIYGIAGFFVAMILGFLIYGIGQINWSAPASNNDPVAQFAGKIEWNKIFNSTYTTIFMMINVVLGLMLLDMYLGKKQRELRGE